MPATEKEAAEVQFQRIKEAYDSLKSTKQAEAFNLHGLEGLRCQKDKICAAQDNALWMNDLVPLMAFYGITGILVGFYVTLRSAPPLDSLLAPSMFCGVLALELCFRGFNDSVKDFDTPPQVEAFLGNFTFFGDLTRYEKALFLRYWLIWYLLSGIVQMIGLSIADMAKPPESSSPAVGAGGDRDDGDPMYFKAMVQQQQRLIRRLEGQVTAITKKR